MKLVGKAGVDAKRFQEGSRQSPKVSEARQALGRKTAEGSFRTRFPPKFPLLHFRDIFNFQWLRGLHKQ